MKRLGLLLLLVFMCAIVFPSAAQDSDDAATYWAVDQLTGDLTAFTPASDTNWLTRIQGDARPRQGWRVSPQRGFVFFEPTDGETQLYRLSPDSAELAMFELPEGLEGVYPFTFNEAVTVLLTIQPRGLDAIIASTMLVLDNETLATRLVLNLHYQSAALSADGTKLRYARIEVQGDDVEFTSVLTELDLATGEQHDVFTFPPNTIVARPGEYGEYFLFLTSDRTTRQNVASVVDLEGSVQVISQYTPDSSVIQIPAMIEGTNEYILYDPRCEENCPLTAGTYDNDETYSFIAPVIDGTISPMHLIVNGLRDAELLLISGESLSLLKSDGSRIDLGKWVAQYGATFDSILSPDGRYLLAYVTDENTSDFSYRVWDLEEERVVMESDEPDNFGIIIVNFTQPERGLLLSERGQRFRVYRDGSVIDLPVVDGGFYYELLPDGSVLFVQNSPDDELARGTYLYDLVSGEFTLLIPDAGAINMREAE